MILHPCTGSLQFHVNDYLALLAMLLIRHVLHLNQILLIWSCDCVVGHPTTFWVRKHLCYLLFLTEFQPKYSYLILVNTCRPKSRKNLIKINNYLLISWKLTIKIVTGNCEWRTCWRSVRGVEPMALRTKGVDSTNAPHTPHNLLRFVSEVMNKQNTNVMFYNKCACLPQLNRI